MVTRAGMAHTVQQFTELVRVAKLQLSGLRDPAVAALLPGAPGVSRDVSDLLDQLLAAVTASRGLPESISQALNEGDGVYRP